MALTFSMTAERHTGSRSLEWSWQAPRLQLKLLHVSASRGNYASKKGGILTPRMKIKHNPAANGLACTRIWQNPSSYQGHCNELADKLSIYLTGTGKQSYLGVVKSYSTRKTSTTSERFDRQLKRYVNRHPGQSPYPT